MKNNPILKYINNSKAKGEKLLALLLDPDKITVSTIPSLCKNIEKTEANLIFVGGSTVAIQQTDIVVKELKKVLSLPIVLFPGDYTQITHQADALLFLNLISGNNPEYLIHQQVKSIPSLQKSSLEVISTGYILIDGGTVTSTMKVSKTIPIPQYQVSQIENTALAGEFMGQKLIYLEAGSGANTRVSDTIIQTISKSLSIPIIVGGGIKNKTEMTQAFENGADVVVIGTSFEKNQKLID